MVAETCLLLLVIAVHARHSDVIISKLESVGVSDLKRQHESASIFSGLRRKHFVTARDRSIYRSTDIRISTGIFIDILVCLSTAHFVPNSFDLVKTFEFYWNLFKQNFSCLANTLCYCNNLHVLLCTFCLDKLVYVAS